MYCPKCGQERLSDKTRFCSRCGYLLTGTAELFESDGEIPGTKDSLLPKALSRRNRGIRQGVFIFLLTFLVFPVLAIIESSYNDYFNVTLVATAVLGIGGLLRIAYAMMFESPAANTPTSGPDGRKVEQISTPAASADLFAAPVTGDWRHSEKLETESGSDGETKKLERDTGQ